MQIKIFTIPILGGESMVAEMNTFLRSQKILQIESQFADHPHGSYWSFCVRYIEGASRGFSKKGKTDYKEVLDEDSFERFSKLREIRRQISKEEAIPAYAIFTDEELSKLAQVVHLTTSSMKEIKGIGTKKIEKYGERFLAHSTHEKNESPD